MRTPIYIRRGNKADLPTLSAGEPGFATDTKELFVGTSTGNEQIHAPYDKTSAFRAHPSGVQSISAGTLTKILFQIEEFDNLSEYDIATSRLTVQKSGIYLITSGVDLTQISGNRAYLSIYVNGGEIARIFDYTIGGATGKLAGAEQVKLLAGHYVEMYAFSANASTTGVASYATYFTATRIA